MLNELDEFLIKAESAARDAHHPWPDYAACEAAVESNWGRSLLAINANNLFGEHQHEQPIYETYIASTREFVNGEWIDVPKAYWVKFPDWRTCFATRIATIVRLAHAYEGYAEALRATNGRDFVIAVSKNWSTDPLRAQKVLSTYNFHKAIFPPQVPSGSSEDPGGQL